VTTLRAQRDAALDLLRGYFLVVMVVDHLHSFPSLFEPLTGRGHMWASAAEGFFAISGCLVGLLRGGEVRGGRIAEVTSKLVRRAALLYLWSVSLTLAYTLAGRLMANPPTVTLEISGDPPLRLLVRALCLRYTYGFADMLPIYALFLALAPLALLLLSGGFTTLVLATSLAFWAGGLLMPLPLRFTGTPFPEMSWQVCFFPALVVGYHAAEVREHWTGLSERTRTLVVLGLCSAALAFGYLSWLDRYRDALWPDHATLLHFLFGKTRVGPGRIVVASVWLLALYVAVKAFEPAFLRAVGWLLIPLGRNSLQVYILHSAAAFFLFNLRTQVFWLASLEDAVVVGVLWLLVTTRVPPGWLPRWVTRAGPRGVTGAAS
jgi:hypothetical protein